jgi:hypothetical protein
MSTLCQCLPGHLVTFSILVDADPQVFTIWNWTKMTNRYIESIGFFPLRKAPALLASAGAFIFWGVDLPLCGEGKPFMPSSFERIGDIEWGF